MDEAFAAAGLAAHFVVGPQAAEVGAVQGQFADQGGQLRVVGVASGAEEEVGDGVASLGLPVGVEIVGRLVEDD